MRVLDSLFARYFIGLIDEFSFTPNSHKQNRELFFEIKKIDLEGSMITLLSNGNYEYYAQM